MFTWSALNALSRLIQRYCWVNSRVDSWASVEVVTCQQPISQKYRGAVKICITFYRSAAVEVRQRRTKITLVPFKCSDKLHSTAPVSWPSATNTKIQIVFSRQLLPGVSNCLFQTLHMMMMLVCFFFIFKINIIFKDPEYVVSSEDMGR